MLFHETSSHASRLLRPSLMPEDSERSAFAFSSVQPEVVYEPWTLANEVDKDLFDSAIDLLAVFGIEPVTSHHGIHGLLPSNPESSVFEDENGTPVPVRAQPWRGSRSDSRGRGYVGRLNAAERNPLKHPARLYRASIFRLPSAQKKPIKAIWREIRVSRKVVRKVIRSEAAEFRYEATSSTGATRSW